MENFFKPDNPNADGSEKDLLHREAYTEKLVKVLPTREMSESLIIGINGAWGSGKTFLKNKVIKALGKEDRIFEFNPWEWSAQHEVFKAFFSELSGFLRKDKKFFELAKIYEKYAAALNNVNYHISNIIGIISVSTLFGIITISIINHFIENEIYKTVLEFFRLCLLSFPAAAIVLLTALKKSKSYFIERLESDSLKDIKDRLIEECKNLKEPLVIVLDDIDRLNPEETAALFQLVKANMDFPNIVMILLYERDHVCFSLEKAGIPDAARYIEKIIQIPLNIPDIEGDDAIEIFNNELESLKIQYKQSIDEERYNYYTYDIITFLFQNIRQIYRFSNSLKFKLEIFKSFAEDGINYDIDFTDLIYLEIIKTIEPKVYDLITECSMHLVGLNRNSFGYIYDKKEREQIKKSTEDKLLNASSDRNRLAVKYLLDRLFPYLRGGLFGMSEEECAAKNRVGHPESFSRYFVFSINKEKTATESAFYKWIRSVSNYTEFANAFDSSGAREKKASLLLKLFRKVEDLDIDNYENLLKLMLKTSEEFDDSGYTTSVTSLSKGIIVKTLNKLKDGSERKNLLLKLLSENEYYEVFFLLLRGQKSDPDIMNLLTEEDFAYLKQKVLDKIKTLELEYANSTAHLSFVLFHWFNDAEDVCKDFVKRLVNSSEQGLLSFMKSKLNMTTSSSHGVYWTMPLKNVSKFIALEEIEPLIDRINVDSLTDRKAKIAITCFRKAKIDNFQDDNKIRDDLDKIAVMDDEFN